MSRYRLEPTAEQRAGMVEHSRHARFVWNLAVQQHVAGPAAARRRDWVEKTSTQLARSYDLIRVEDLNIHGMTRNVKGTVDHPGSNVRQKAGLNRAILSHGRGLLVSRPENKPRGRVEQIHAAYTS